MYKNKFGFFISYLVFGLSACSVQGDDSQNYLAEKKALLCRMEKLTLANDSLWEEMSLYLEQALPVEMSPSERTNLIKIKNAHLITMFKAFPKLDTAIQNKVHTAGIKDKEIAAEMKSVMARLDEVEQKLNKTLEYLESSDKENYKKAKQQMLELDKRPCL